MIVQNISDQFKNLWRTRPTQLLTGFFKDNEETLLEKNLTELSPKLTRRIKCLVKDLPEPPVYRKAVQEALMSNLRQWQENPSIYPNNLVILTSPIESVASLFKGSKQDWQDEKQIPFSFLQWNTRPIESITMLMKLKAELERQEEHPEVVLVPDYNHFFLRRIDGFEGIKHLRNTVVKDRSRFWLIGCQSWAWRYFKLGCQIDSFFNETLSLPVLNGTQLQEWLTPTITQVKIDFIQRTKDSEQNKDQQKAQKIYFEKLANKSGGVASLALQLFLNSLRYEVTNLSSDDEHIAVRAEEPSLPDVPDLSFEEQYLLFSLILHGSLSLPNLSSTLEEVEDVVVRLVQNLHRTQIIEQRDELLRINLIYYPKLRDLLDKNHFMIAKADASYKQIIFK